MTLAFIDYPVWDQLIYTIEQRIAAIYVHEICTDEPMQSAEPYKWYRRNNTPDGYQSYSIEALGEVPVSYRSNNGFVLSFTSTDTVHIAFLKILKSEYEAGVIDGTLELRDGSQRSFEMDLTGN